MRVKSKPVKVKKITLPMPKPIKLGGKSGRKK